MGTQDELTDHCKTHLVHHLNVSGFPRFRLNRHGQVGRLASGSRGLVACSFQVGTPDMVCALSLVSLQHKRSPILGTPVLRSSFFVACSCGREPSGFGTIVLLWQAEMQFGRLVASRRNIPFLEIPYTLRGNPPYAGKKAIKSKTTKAPPQPPNGYQMLGECDILWAVLDHLQLGPGSNNCKKADLASASQLPTF